MTSPIELREWDLLLRPWSDEDVPALIEACNDPEIARWIPLIPSPYTEADALAFVHGEIAKETYSFAIVRSDDLVGAIGLSVNKAGHTGHIGYWVAAPARGGGICTRALHALSRFALEDLELRRLELITDPDNTASQRVAEKVGFRREGVLRSHLLHADGRLRDSVMFSLLPGELLE